MRVKGSTGFYYRVGADYPHLSSIDIACRPGILRDGRHWRRICRNILGGVTLPDVGSCAANLLHMRLCHIGKHHDNKLLFPASFGCVTLPPWPITHLLHTRTRNPSGCIHLVWGTHRLAIALSNSTSLVAVSTRSDLLRTGDHDAGSPLAPARTTCTCVQA